MVLSQVINQLANPNTYSNRRRRLYIPPSTNYPLFSYGGGDDQRSFLSLDESSSFFMGQDDGADVASISSSRSLPSTLSSLPTSEDQESFHSWLQEEHARRYSAINDNDSMDRRSHGSRSSRPSTKSGALVGIEDFGRLRTTNGRESRMLLRYSLPLVVTFVLEHFFSIVCLLVVGHLGKNELAAVSLGSMTCTISLATFEGIATALDTLCPQAYGAGNLEMVSVHVQRCMMFSMIIFVPIGLFWWNSHYLLRYVIQEQQVLELTTLFLRIFILGGPPYIFFECFKRFLQAQGIFEAGTGVLFVSAPLNIALSWFLVWNKTYGIGYAGAPLATVINFWVMDILLVMYTVFIDGKKCWNGFCSFADLFKRWGQLSHLAIPGIIMLESEYVAYEIMTLFASYFGTVELAAQSAVASIASLTYMVPFAVSIAASTRIANFIGGQNIFSARKATHISLVFGLIVSCLNGLVLWSAKGFIARLFTKDEDVVALIERLLNPLVSVLQIFDGSASIASGVLRAQGQQKIGGLINFLSYYAFGLPLALVLCKTLDLKLFGLWIGIGSGMVLISVSETIFVLLCDWDAIMMKAGLMIESDTDSDL